MKYDYNVSSVPINGNLLASALDRYDRSGSQVTILGWFQRLWKPRKSRLTAIPGEKLLVNAEEFDYNGEHHTDAPSTPLVFHDFMSRSDSPGAEQEKENNWWELCPICGSKLLNRKCRFVCSNPQCHFFMSCSEFDL
jgi:hypothetical protein